jgi:hypothetical protein
MSGAVKRAHLRPLRMSAYDASRRRCLFSQCGAAQLTDYQQNLIAALVEVVSPLWQMHGSQGTDQRSLLLISIKTITSLQAQVCSGRE